jgi:hypothetical protein
MRYPVLSRAVTAELVQELVRGTSPGLDDFTTWEGNGPKLETAHFEEVAESLRAALTSFETSDARADADMFEGQASSAIHEMLSNLPLAIIDDPGFWRYLSLTHFWWLAVWRHPSAFESDDPALHLRYVDGVQTTECVLSRMYLRAQIAEIDGDYSLTTAVAQGSDFWRSHILRVSTGSSPALSRALLREQADRRMTTDKVRALARDLNRISSNVVLSIYDEDDAAALVTELREEERTR